MAMIPCKNGHFFDNEINDSCPYCPKDTIENITEKTEVVENQTDSKTKIYTDKNTLNSTKKEDEGKTVFISRKTNSIDKEEVDINSNPILLSGWLVIISDKGKGKSYPLTFGLNNIGRGDNNHISIKNGDDSISREKHTTIIYDYQNNIFLVKHGEGQFLSYLNGAVLLDTKELKANDKIKVGNTEFIFIPLCSENFKWE